MDVFSKAVLSKCISQKASVKPTAFPNLNDVLNGGLPNGRLIEIYGRSQIGKTSLALSLFPDESIIYLDLARKLCLDYTTDKVLMAPNVNNDEVFDLLLSVIPENVICIIDDLTMLGSIRNDADRFSWLMHSFNKLQRELVSTNSIVIVLNQIRIAPNTNRSYNPHEGCLDAAVKIKMHHAEKKSDGELVYLDIEKHFWGKEGERCTLLVSKNKIETPSFYKPRMILEEESVL